MMCGTPSLADLAEGLSEASAHRRLLVRLTNRWIKGTGFVHRSVGTDLIDRGLAESRLHHNERQIRISALGWEVRNHLLSQGKEKQ